MKMYSVVASSSLTVMIINGYSGHGKTFILAQKLAESITLDKLNS